MIKGKRRIDQLVSLVPKAQIISFDFRIFLYIEVWLDDGPRWIEDIVLDDVSSK